MTLGQFEDNLYKGHGSPSGRSIKQGTVLIMQWPGSEKGYLVGGIYSGKYPVIIREDGLPGNQRDIDTNAPDIQDGKLEIPTYHKYGDKSPVINFPIGTYTLHVEASDDPKADPEFKNIEFDIVP